MLYTLYAEKKWKKHMIFSKFQPHSIYLFTSMYNVLSHQHLPFQYICYACQWLISIVVRSIEMFFFFFFCSFVLYMWHYFLLKFFFNFSVDAHFQSSNPSVSFLQNQEFNSWFHMDSTYIFILLCEVNAWVKSISALYVNK